MRNQQVSGRRDLKQRQSSSNGIKTEIKERCQRRARRVRSTRRIPRKKQTRNERTWAAVRRIPPRGPSGGPASRRGYIQHGCGQFGRSSSGSTPQRCGSRSDMSPSVLVTGWKLGGLQIGAHANVENTAETQQASEPQRQPSRRWMPRRGGEVGWRRRRSRPDMCLHFLSGRLLNA